MLCQLDGGTYRYYFRHIGIWNQCSAPAFWYHKKNGVHVKREHVSTNTVEEHNSPFANKTDS